MTSLEFRRQDPEWDQAARAYGERIWRPAKVLVALLGLLLVAGAGFVYTTRPEGAIVRYLVRWLPLGLVLVGWWHLPKLGRREFLKRSRFAKLISEPTTLSFGTSEVVLNSNQERHTLPYDGFRRAQLHNGSLALVASRGDFLLVPAYALPEGTGRELLEVLDASGLPTEEL